MSDADIRLQASPDACDLIEQAATLLGKSRSDFLLEAACERAKSVVLDQVFFSLREETFKQFTGLLIAPQTRNEGLERLMQVPNPWESKAHRVTLKAPTPFLADHIPDLLECGEPSIDDWLKLRALPNQMSGASRTFVTTDSVGRVYGYYSMAAGTDPVSSKPVTVTNICRMPCRSWCCSASPPTSAPAAAGWDRLCSGMPSTVPSKSRSTPA